jgi:hypothetical protein
VIRRLIVGLLGVAIAGATASAASYFGQDLFVWKPRPAVKRSGSRDKSFQRVGTFANYRNNPMSGPMTASEIVAATSDGQLLVYSDGLLRAIGFINIANPGQPQPAGRVTFPTGHFPTSVDVLGNRYALVGVNTSVSFTSPSGYLAVVDVVARTIVRQIDLGGQPDSLKVSPDGKYVAVAIENERDEAFGGLPQVPAGYLAIIDLNAPDPFSWTRFDVALTGLAEYGESDPEPEFVDINERNEAVVSLQENNHIVIVDLRQRVVVEHFPAGASTVDDIDAEENGVVELTETLPDVAREPDAVTWAPGPGNHVQIATLGGVRPDRTRQSNGRFRCRENARQGGG